MKVVGLTGSIAMGKSEVANILRRSGIPVYDADATVHRIYASSSAAKSLSAHFPEAITNQGVDRKTLARLVTGRPEKLRLLESLVHPLVRKEEQDFLESANNSNAPLVILDIPLLFEIGRESSLDAVIVVSAPKNLQHERALSRPGMTRGKLETILARQMPDQEKRRRATYVIENNGSLVDLENKVQDLLGQLQKPAQQL